MEQLLEVIKKEGVPALTALLDIREDLGLPRLMRVLIAWYDRYKSVSYDNWAELMSKCFFTDFWSLLWRDNAVNG